MKNSAILRTAKVGGFNKEDVLTYVDELNAKIDSLKSELEQAKAVQADVSELDNYKNEVERLRERLSETEIKLSEVRTDADSAKMELQNEKDAVSEENSNLKNEIESLKYQLEAAQNASVTAAAEVQPVDTTEFENEISDLKIQLENAKNQISEMSGEMTKLTSDISEKAKKIEQLTLDNNELRLQTDDSSFSGDFDMGALFSEAQATAKKVVVEARMAADKLVRDAQSESDKIIREAKEKADRINAEAVGKAAIMEEDAKKNAQNANAAAGKLKSIFRTEIDTLSKQFSEAMENIDAASRKLGSEIETAKKTISENVDSFINDNEVLNDVEKTSEPVSYYMPEIDTEIPSVNSGQEENDEDDYSFDSSPYISMPDREDDDTEEQPVQYDSSDEEEPYIQEISGKNNDAEIDDILSSFAIDPVTDEEDEPVPLKKNPSLGFDLGDLEKLAAEAEKDL